MNYIKEIISKDNPTIEELINCFNCIKQEGNVVVIKFDGERVDIGYTIFITFPKNLKQEMIRVDERELKSALYEALTKYTLL